ncbi:DNA-directed RNA polymerase specialized sigma24 family protein [Bradyrhizobium sp. USDA 4509]
MTAETARDDAAADFAPLRPGLMRVAYRMLGSVADDEDMVQEAFIRWMKADRSEVRETEAFLRRTVTRLCLDQLKSARAASARPMSARGFRIPSSRSRTMTSPCR